MFIFNLKLNGKFLAKFFITILLIIVLIFLGISIYKIYSNSFKVSDNIDSNEKIMYLTAENYTDILKTIHEDIDTYIGRKICFTGYVYRLSDFKDTEFVLARDMLISSNNQSLIVGFLCDYKKTKDFKNGTWVEIYGKIVKGNYHGDIPVIKISEIKEIEMPKDDIYCYPPSNTYIPTSNIF